MLYNLAGIFTADQKAQKVKIENENNLHHNKPTTVSDEIMEIGDTCSFWLEGVALVNTSSSFNLILEFQKKFAVQIKNRKSSKRKKNQSEFLICRALWA